MAMCTWLHASFTALLNNIHSETDIPYDSDLASAHHFRHLRKDFINDKNVLDRFRHLKFQKCIKKFHSRSISDKLK